MILNAFWEKTLEENWFSAMVMFPKHWETARAVLIPFATMYICKPGYSTPLSINTLAARWIHLQIPYFRATLQFHDSSIPYFRATLHFHDLSIPYFHAALQFHGLLITYFCATLQFHDSPFDCAGKLFKPSKDSSLLVCNEKNSKCWFLLCEWWHSVVGLGIFGQSYRVLGPVAAKVLRQITEITWMHWQTCVLLSAM